MTFYELVRSCRLQMEILHKNEVMITDFKHMDVYEEYLRMKGEGAKMLEVLNPRYAEEKKQAKVISDLEKRQMETDKKLDSILSILTKLDSPTK